VHTDEALVEVGHWLRGYHEAVTDFVPPRRARWRTSPFPWRPGDIIDHNQQRSAHAANTAAPWRRCPLG
jgi:hypothetical protein